MTDASSLITQTEEFVKQAFIQNPHYSFDDWTVMYNHSVMVKDIVLEITNEIVCDKETIEIGALLHDIGKTYKTDLETLHTEHESFNLLVSENFLENLDLPKEKLEKIKQLVAYTSGSTEMNAIKDADTIAFYKDKKLYMLFIKWAHENKLDWAIKRKLEKFNNLYFDVSREIAEPLRSQMKRDWEEYLKKPSSIPAKTSSKKRAFHIQK